MKAITLCAAIVGIVTTAANAANITWGSPTTISGASDVNTLGNYFGSWAPYDGGANGAPVNGVTFQGFSDLPGLSTFQLDNGYNGFASPGTSDGNYNSLLQYATFSNESTPATFSWSGMTPGNTYLVQLWVHDGRNSIVNAPTETVTGGANTSAPLAYGSGDSGPGQYIIGIFVADNTGSETLTLSPGAAIPSAQLNLFQVRDVSAVPEPTSLALLTIGAGVLCAFRRKSNRA